ncbi:haloacid dehalogenase superfamily, subfamily IA [Methanocella conradii HZ254]|uniref:Haloacid dehalogenase superfamily, subfamily IA n=1 Tax=Methanocella conradii (strain DSM 24694 / JCM 17849 / CGMCC 1.5162 / HZ254) TaxID=1041930 RepID=H8I7R6_METCZ|nr:HAD family hydrolase [Methanocella conradii]AFC99901.1 haloacid dehalogenase superfamily, subfamily IA [Methanocella conradii HZ254]
MKIKAVISDIYTTLIDVRTDEEDKDVYRRLASYLKYHGVYLSADELKWFFFEKKALQKKQSKEPYPEADYRRLWYDILRENQYAYSGPDIDKSSIVPDIAKLHRALTVERIRLYRGVYETLAGLKPRYRLGIVSDSQVDHAYPELRMLGIHDFFDAIVVSAEFGFRKPDVRLFSECLRRLGARPEESVYVGNDTMRDIKGAKDAGMVGVLIMTKHGKKDRDIVAPDFTIEYIGQLNEVLGELEKR